MHREILEGQLGISGRERYQKGLIPHAVKKTIDLGYFPYVTENKDKKNRSRVWSVFGTERNILNGTYHQATKLSEAIKENQIRTKL